MGGEKKRLENPMEGICESQLGLGTVQTQRPQTKKLERLSALYRSRRRESGQPLFYPRSHTF
jgi:hypothetical protein